MANSIAAHRTPVPAQQHCQESVSAPGAQNASSFLYLFRNRLDNCTGDRQFHWAILPIAHNLERDLGICQAAHLLYGLIECQSLNWLVIEMGDNVIRLDPSL